MRTFTDEEIVSIAKICHDTNRSYCQTLGDDSQPVWEEAPGWQRNSAIQGVKFHIDNPGTTPEDTHMSWMIQKLKDGWCYGPVKDAEKKEHPCFLPYWKLSPEQRLKDALFSSIVKCFLLTEGV